MTQQVPTLSASDRVWRFQKGNRGTVVWCAGKYAGIRWDNADAAVYGYDYRREGIQRLSPLEQLAEQVR